MLEEIKGFLLGEKVYNKAIIEKMYDGQGIENMSNEELRDYFIALGKYDLCCKLLCKIKGMKNIELLTKGGDKNVL